MLVKISHRNMVGSPRERFSTFTPSSGASTWVRNCGRSFSYSTYWDDCLILRSGNSNYTKKNSPTSQRSLLGIGRKKWSHQPIHGPLRPTVLFMLGHILSPGCLFKKMTWHGTVEPATFWMFLSSASSATGRTMVTQSRSRKSSLITSLSWFFSSQNLAKFGFYSLGMGTSTWK